MHKKWYLVNIAVKFFSNHPQLKGTVVCLSFHSFICMQKNLVKHFIIFKASDALFIIALNKKKPINVLYCLTLPTVQPQESY